jgi:hypothetical protein
LISGNNDLVCDELAQLDLISSNPTVQKRLNWLNPRALSLVGAKAKCAN